MIKIISKREEQAASFLCSNSSDDDLHMAEQNLD